MTDLIQKTTLHCRSCPNIWVERLPVAVEVQVWAEAALALRCPKCGSASIGLGKSEPPEPA